MKYFSAGKKFCEELNNICIKEHYNCAVVTGGGYAYKSIKYINDENPNKDFDFMIVYDQPFDLSEFIEEMYNETSFTFDINYISSDIQLIKNNTIDIIRVTGKYDAFKATINLVPLSAIISISKLETRVLKKIAHNRNTSLFFARNTKGFHTTTIFFSPYFETNGKEIHYIHLDFTCKELNDSLHLGILADAVLKGFQKNYDNINFSKIRESFIMNLGEYVNCKNDKGSFFYSSVFANWNYFSVEVKDYLCSEYERITRQNLVLFDSLVNDTYSSKSNTIFLYDDNINVAGSPFVFSKYKKRSCSLLQYIKQKQNTEYDRQYLIDAWGKLLSCIYWEKKSIKGFPLKNYTLDINQISILGVNDIYIPAEYRYGETTSLLIIKWIINHCSEINFELISALIRITNDFFLTFYKKHLWETEILESYEIEFIRNLLTANVKRSFLDMKTFNEVAMLHNSLSKVMPVYTKEEGSFLEQIFSNKNAEIIDVMCGIGRIANELKSRGFNNVFGIDMYDYSSLNNKRDFIFIKKDFYQFTPKESFQYAVCLYNCFSSINEIDELLKRLFSITASDCVVVIDFFNSRWRESTDSIYLHTVFDDNNVKVNIIREYIKPIETTKYQIFFNNELIHEVDFSQRFFSSEELECVIEKNWYYEKYTSKDLHLRGNSQKLIYVLRKAKQ